jgi:hypothetical protein
MRLPEHRFACSCASALPMPLDAPVMKMFIDKSIA